MRWVLTISICSAGLLAPFSARAQGAPAVDPSDPAEAGEPPDIAALEARVADLEARITRIASDAEPSEEAAAEVEDDAEAEEPAEEEEPAAAEEDDEEPFTIGGWVEAYYAWSFNEPSNGIIDLRGFDNRHDSFNLSNVAVDAQWDVEGVNGRITLQWGSTPATYYLSETAAPTVGTSVGAQSSSLWQLLQQAYGGYRIPVGNGLNVLAGLFLSPVGAEGMNVKDNWFYSRSNLFFGFPFYHTGIRISYSVIPEVTVHAWVVNGWNTVLDNNDEKTVMLQATWATDVVSGSFLYMTGVERPEGAPEGRAWRHLIDLNSTFTLTDWLGLQGQLTTMIEPNDFGTSAAVAGALAARVAPVEWLALSARGDFFWETVATSSSGTASAIFWPSEWVSSFTASAELRAVNHVSFRLEFRHDHAAGPSYFRGSVSGNGIDAPFLRNTRYQDTVTLGATTWF